MIKKFFPLLIVFLLPLVNAQTVYFKNETANFILSLTDSFGNPISNADCYGYIYKPDMTLLDSFKLNYDSTTGVYYHQFNVPDSEGTYLEVGKCIVNLFGRNRTIYDRKTFFVTSALKEFQEQMNELIENATLNITVDITGNLTQSFNNLTQNVTSELFYLEDLIVAFHSTPIINQYCKDNKTLVIVRRAIWNINNRTLIINKTEEIPCTYGCDPKTNECLRQPYVRVLIAIGVFILVVAVILILWRFRYR